MILRDKILVAGPCAAESKQQVLSTAEKLASVVKRTGARLIYRAGLWKPRTSPHSFQGVGEEGLTWLQETVQLTNLPVATEVSTPEQVHMALHARIPYLWLGARTCANPIAVQELADVIRQSNYCPEGVLIKNPVNEDAHLWLGNIERMESVGVPVIAVHRGCNHRPCWRMAYQLRQLRADIPLLLDPSHMSGERAMVPLLANKAAALHYDGWMIEVHPTPEQALSDSRQQITPDELEHLISDLKNFSDEKEALDNTPIELRWLRAEIDEIDDTLWTAIAERMDIVRHIGEVKQQNHLDAYQPNRYQAMLAQRMEWADKNGLPREAVRSILDVIHDASVSLQH